ncbi:MAG: NAD-dependent glycerol-3-phosphate dehydrogenase [Acidimicrobiia bacterium]|nr:MAG: NAD-dependent glycerol-3-phosphate dehydrogenase [Acidimicrobiia bacterium]
MAQPRTLVVVGPGRAGGSVALAAQEAGYRLAGVVPGPSGRVPFPAPSIRVDQPIPDCDLLVVAVRDDQIRPVAERLGSRIGRVGMAVHLSGSRPISDLASLGVPHGSFHPLQTLPDPVRGARSLAGAWAGVTGSDGDVTAALERFAGDLGMKPFHLDDAAKPAYHAAAAAGSNFVVAALGLAAALFRTAGLDFEVLAPLTRTVVDNVFELGPEAALTGPVARGDWGTVAAQVAAADRAGVGDQFRLLVRVTAGLAGLTAEAEAVLG